MRIRVGSHCYCERVVDFAYNIKANDKRDNLPDKIATPSTQKSLKTSWPQENKLLILDTPVTTYQSGATVCIVKRHCHCYYTAIVYH